MLLIIGFIGGWQLLGYFFVFLPLFLFTSFCCFSDRGIKSGLLQNALVASGLSVGAYLLFVFTLDIQFG
jgi:hypothetical protein